MYGDRPLSKLESGLYVIVVSVLVLLLLERMLVHFAFAERAMVETTLLRMQSALHTRFAYDLLRDKAGDADAWSSRNPFELAVMQVENFAGERDATDARTLQSGMWTYDPKARQLVYLPRFPSGLSIDGGGDALRFRLSLGPLGTAPRLVPVVPYRWAP